MDRAFAEMRWGTTLVSVAAKGGLAREKDEPPRLSTMEGAEAR
jgi:hypothetical protein